MAFYAVGTTSGAETTVATALGESQTPHIHAVMAPQQLESYVIVEADGVPPVETAVAETPRARKILSGQTSLAEVQSYLSPTAQVTDVSTGDIIDITGGPYKGKQARVQSIDRDKDQLTVELFDEPIPIPVAINGDQFRSQ